MLNNIVKKINPVVFLLMPVLYSYCRYRLSSTCLLILYSRYENALLIDKYYISIALAIQSTIL